MQQPECQDEGQRECVLFVDPDTAMHLQIVQELGGLFLLRHARTAQEALTSLERRLPDLIISEVELPDMSGLDLCERLRGAPATAGLPIVFLTSHAGINDKVAGFMAGADDYVIKPLDPRFFSARIRLLFRLKTLEQHHPTAGGDSPSRPFPPPARSTEG